MSAHCIKNSHGFKTTKLYNDDRRKAAKKRHDLELSRNEAKKKKERREKEDKGAQKEEKSESKRNL